jgi:hypothetical protein
VKAGIAAQRKLVLLFRRKEEIQKKHSQFALAPLDRYKILQMGVGVIAANDLRTSAIRCQGPAEVLSRC